MKRLKGLSAACLLAGPLALATTGVPSAVGATAPLTSSTVVVFAAVQPDGQTTSVVSLDLATGIRTELIPASQGILYREPESGPGGRVVMGYSDGVANGIAIRDPSGAIRRITSHPSSVVTPQGTTFDGDGSPTFSPDGQRVVFQRLTERPGQVATSRLHEIPADVAGPSASTPLPGTESLYEPAFSPDGRLLAGWSFGTNGSVPTRIRVRDMQTGELRDVEGGVDGRQPAFSPDGSTVAFSVRTVGADTPDLLDDSEQIATAPVAGGPRLLLAATRPAGATGRTVASKPSWLPDGRSLVYSLATVRGDGAGRDTGLYAVDALGRRSGPVDGSAGDINGPEVSGGPPARVVAAESSVFVPVDPVRVLDTRSGVGAAGPVGTRGRIDLQLTGTSGIPAGATAALLNITAVGATGPTNVRVFPSDAPAVPTVSNLNVTRAGQTVPNSVTSALSSDGSIALVNAAGSTHLVADLFGYYTADEGVGYEAVEPVRILDSRQGWAGDSGPLPAGGVRELEVAGTLRTTDGSTVVVPESARAVVLNVTGVRATAATDLRVYPADAGSDAIPRVSSLNLERGDVVPNLVTVAVGDDGRIRFHSPAAAVDVVVDLAGYYDDQAQGRFVPVQPVRFLDTRSGTGAVPLPLGQGETLDWYAAADRGVPAGVTAVALNLTGTGTTQDTVVRAFAPRDEVPRISNLNLRRGETRANAVLVPPASDGRLRVLTGSGQVDLIADLSGYFVVEP